MDRNVWSLKYVKLLPHDYIVILLAWNQFSNRVTDEIRKHAKEFGHLMSYKGVLVMPYDDRMKDALGEVLEKNWPPSIRQKIQDEKYPFLLIINADFEDFDPRDHKSAFVWFSDFRNDEQGVWQVFDTIARKIEQRQDLIRYLTEIAKEAELGRFQEQLAELPKYVNVTVPIVPGIISVNAGAVWAAAVRWVSGVSTNEAKPGD